MDEPQCTNFQKGCVASPADDAPGGTTEKMELVIPVPSQGISSGKLFTDKLCS
jgi:hypothetical protein